MTSYNKLVSCSSCSKTTERPGEKKKEILGLACVVDTLNLLYRLYKWFRRVRGPAATQVTESPIVKNRFLRVPTKNHCLGFLAIKSQLL